MRGKLKDLTFGRDGEQNITVSTMDDFRTDFDNLYGVDVEIIIKKYRKRRSLDANAYAWVLIDKIALTLKTSKEEVYKDAIRSIGGVSETVAVRNEAVEKLCTSWSKNGIGWQAETFRHVNPAFTNVTLYYGSSTYDTDQMKALIEELVFLAKSLNIETMTPEELMKLEGLLNDQNAPAR